MFHRLYVYSVCFFFQAEDGIRDLVRSRGLGDVYKRQQPYFTMYVPPRPEGSQSSYLLPILAVAAVALAAAGYLYRRRKMNGKNGGISQSKKENRAL